MKYNLDLKPSPKGFRFWYSFNKHKIPVYITFLSFFFYTAFLDFNMVGTPFMVQSHIRTVFQIHSMSSFALFIMYLIAIVQLFNVMSYSKKLNPFGAITYTILTAIQAFLVVYYAILVLTTRPVGVNLQPFMIFSIFIFVVGLIFMIIANVFVWIYVDWKYVKIEED